uniref:Uncharacterized protein n=1 Tax=Lotharella oceanica TaxID=641309 RepID=A0A7S2U3N8_9EUKA|mmetsp:Transcript_6560/g.12992  ORF Transcript_6560/g.12992 Transcript_6560/m.12992 type:complete len:240 (+) Transcript_6560:188-907(+)
MDKKKKSKSKIVIESKWHPRSQREYSGEKSMRIVQDSARCKSRTNSRALLLSSCVRGDFCSEFSHSIYFLHCVGILTENTRQKEKRECLRMAWKLNVRSRRFLIPKLLKSGMSVEMASRGSMAPKSCRFEQSATPCTPHRVLGVPPSLRHPLSTVKNSPSKKASLHPVCLRRAAAANKQPFAQPNKLNLRVDHGTPSSPRFDSITIQLSRLRSKKILEEVESQETLPAANGRRSHAANG